MFKLVKEVKKEAEKVVYPTKDELKRNTIVTIVFCTAAAVFLWGVSEIIIKLVSLVVG